MTRPYCSLCFESVSSRLSSSTKIVSGSRVMVSDLMNRAWFGVCSIYHFRGSSSGMAGCVSVFCDSSYGSSTVKVSSLKPSLWGGDFR